jgi:hypothetical protein
MHLSLGSTPASRSAAEKELATPSDASQSIAVADAWFDIAEAESGLLEQAMIRRHALDWYRQARDDAQGLARKKVDLRITGLEEIFPADTTQGAGSDQTSLADVLAFRVKTATESRSDFANRKGKKFNIGMGPRPDGRGEALAGLELQGVEKLTVVGSASHQDMLEVDAYSKVGFMIDYHTPGGYAKRVFLGLGLKPGREFSDAPPWGTAKPPDVSTDIGRATSYEIDLKRWAPSTWDGRFWFTVLMQNAGTNRSLEATVSW